MLGLTLSFPLPSDPLANCWCISTCLICYQSKSIPCINLQALTSMRISSRIRQIPELNSRLLVIDEVTQGITKETKTKITGKPLYSEWCDAEVAYVLTGETVSMQFAKDGSALVDLLQTHFSPTLLDQYVSYFVLHQILLTSC